MKSLFNVVVNSMFDQIDNNPYINSTSFWENADDAIDQTILGNVDVDALTDDAFNALYIALNAIIDLDASSRQEKEIQAIMLAYKIRMLGVDKNEK